MGTVVGSLFNQSTVVGFMILRLTLFYFICGIFQFSLTLHRAFQPFIPFGLQVSEMLREILKPRPNKRSLYKICAPNSVLGKTCRLGPRYLLLLVLSIN